MSKNATTSAFYKTLPYSTRSPAPVCMPLPSLYVLLFGMMKRIWLITSLKVMSFGWLFIRIGSFLQVFGAWCVSRQVFFIRFFVNVVLRGRMSCCWRCLDDLEICGRICTRWSRCKHLIFTRFIGHSFSIVIRCFCQWFRCLTQFRQKERLVIGWLQSWDLTQAFWLYRFFSFGKWNCRYPFTRIPLLVNWGKTSYRQPRTRLTLQESIGSGSFSCCLCTHCAVLTISFTLSKRLLKYFTELW